MGTLSLMVLDCHVKIRCYDDVSRTLLLANYSHLTGDLGSKILQYAVGMDEDSGGFFIIRAGQERLIASDPGEFLFLFEKDMTVEIQKLRHDLYFLHAAVLQFGNEAVMLVGESGSGKSTTAWGLLHHGFRYWSDELGPVDLQTLEVHPYPHALSLKHVPPEPYVPPKSTLYTSRSLYIPTVGLPSQVGRTPAPLLAVFFLRSRFGASAPRIQTMSKATAVAHLLANALNPLAHVGDGIDAAMKIAMNMASFDLTAADLRQTCILVKTTLHDLEKPAADGSVPGTL